MVVGRSAAAMVTMFFGACLVEFCAEFRDQVTCLQNGIRLSRRRSCAPSPALLLAAASTPSSPSPHHLCSTSFSSSSSDACRRYFLHSLCFATRNKCAQQQICCRAVLAVRHACIRDVTSFDLKIVQLQDKDKGGCKLNAKREIEDAAALLQQQVSRFGPVRCKMTTCNQTCLVTADGRSACDRTPRSIILILVHPLVGTRALSWHITMGGKRTKGVEGVCSSSSFSASAQPKE